MTKEKLSALLKDIPNRIVSPIKMKEANSIIDIHKGEFELLFSDKKIPITGSIKFQWFPNSGTYFEGNPVIEIKDLINLDKANQVLTVVANGLPIGEAIITHTSFGNTKINSHIKGVFSNQAIWDDKSISVQKIIFSVPNLRDFHGESIKVITGENVSVQKGRVILENDEYTIILDKSENYKELRSSLEEKGGYVILYNGELSRINKSLTYRDLKEILHCLDTFLSFLNGRRTSALFIHGMHEDEVKWCDYTDYFVDTYKAVITWPQQYSLKGINDVWKNFSRLWKNNDDKSFLTSLIHWYVEANGYSGFTEGSLIMAQTALELLYNWWIVERKTMITGKDSENISASNKIRLLLSQINVDHSVPLSFSELNKFIKNEPEIKDGPDAIVQIRNAIVHSQREKRMKLSSIYYKAKYEALQLCIWYLELSLLKILDFNEYYRNRCSGEIYISKSEEPMPWNEK